MPWGNPAFGSGGQLVYTSIRSPNYIAGTAGWIINKDGTVEVNNATIRGTLQSSNYAAGVSGWILNNAGTAELNQLTARGTLQSSNYSANTSGWKVDVNGTAEFNSVTIRGNLYANGTNSSYVYVIPSTPGAGSQASVLLGPDADQTGGSTSNPGSIAAQLDLTGATPHCAYTDITSPDLTVTASGITYTPLSLTLFSADTSGASAFAQVDGDMYVLANLHAGPDGTDTGYGVKGTDMSQGSSAAIAGTESVVMTVPLHSYYPNRTYEVTIAGRVQMAAVNGVALWHVRKSNAAGQLLCDLGRTDCTQVTTYTVSATGYFTVGATTVTTTISLTLQGAAANAATMIGSTTGTRSVVIKDIGDSSLFPSAVVLV